MLRIQCIGWRHYFSIRDGVEAHNRELGWLYENSTYTQTLLQVLGLVDHIRIWFSRKSSSSIKTPERATVLPGSCETLPLHFFLSTYTTFSPFSRTSSIFRHNVVALGWCKESQVKILSMKLFSVSLYRGIQDIPIPTCLVLNQLDHRSFRFKLIGMKFRG